MADRTERGQVTPLVAIVIVVAGALTVMVGRLGQNAADQARAQVAADAAALAGAVEGEDGARDLAEQNGAELLAFVEDDEGVSVRVAVRRAEALARAVATWPDDGVDCASEPKPWHSDSLPVTRSPRSVREPSGDKAREQFVERSPGWPRADECGASSAGSIRGASSALPRSST